MNRNGNYKKWTLIAMIIAVVFSVACILWVIIFKGDNNFERTNREFFEQTSATQYAQAVDSDDADNLSDIEIKVSATFALDASNKTSKLTQEQKQLGFKSVSNDGDNTLTYIISGRDYESFLSAYRNDMLINMNGYFKTDFPSAQNIEYNNELSEISVKMSRADFNAGDIETTATLASLPALTYQMYALSEDSGCEIKIIDAASGEVMAEYEF